MSSTNFVSELVIMAKAMEELPVVKDQLEMTRKQYAEAGETIQNLQLRILDYKNSYDGLAATLTKTEADRDEAVRAFLEADDRAQQAVGFIRQAMSSSASFLQAVEPPAPVPVVQPETGEVSGVSDQAGVSVPVDPTATSGANGTDTGQATAAPVASAIPINDQPPVGGDIPTQGPSVEGESKTSAATPEPSGSTSSETATPTAASPVVPVVTSGDPANIDSVASAPGESAQGEPQSTSPNWATPPNSGGSTEQSSAHTGESAPLPPTGHPAQPFDASPATNTDAPSNTTSPDEVGSTGNMGSVQTDPTAPLDTASATSTADQGSVTTSASIADVSYSSEPIYTSSPEWVEAWTDWSRRMDTRYGEGNWPQRP